MEHFMNGVTCPALYFAVGGIVAAVLDAHRHTYAESLTGTDTDRARRICLWGWAADMLLWPLYAFEAVGAGVAHLLKRGRA